MIKANNFENVFKVLMAIVFGAMTAGQSGAMAPDFGEACAAAHRVIKEGCPIVFYFLDHSQNYDKKPLTTMSTVIK